MLFFFFSSRRRHTRLQGDWSSDVCSSDLVWSGGSVKIIVRMSRASEAGICPCGAIARSRSNSARRDEKRSSRDRKSTRLNSSHLVISYAVFCLKKKKKKKITQPTSKDMRE